MGPVVVVGATGAIGGAIARLMAGQGRALHLVGRDEARLVALAAELGATMAICDVRDDAALTAAVRQAGERIGGLAYCVGSIVLKPLKRATDADFLEAYALNVVGAARAVAAAADALRAAGGAVVLFSSVAARAGFPNHAVIGSAKAAVEGLTVALAAELAPQIRVNAIAPSLTRSAMSQPLLASETVARALAAQHPLARLGEASDAAAMAAFLLGPDAGWITGQVFAIDGGRSSVRSKG